MEGAIADEVDQLTKDWLTSLSRLNDRGQVAESKGTILTTH